MGLALSSSRGAKKRVLLLSFTYIVYRQVCPMAQKRSLTIFYLYCLQTVFFRRHKKEFLTIFYWYCLEFSLMAQKRVLNRLLLILYRDSFVQWHQKDNLKKKILNHHICAKEQVFIFTWVMFRYFQICLSHLHMSYIFILCKI